MPGRPLAIGAVLLAAAFLWAATGRAEPPPVVRAVAFAFLKSDGYIVQDLNGTRFPLSPDVACIGWRIVLGRATEEVEMREVYQLPAPAEIWGYDAATTTISEDRTRATTVTTLRPMLRRVIERSWCITEGDPEGPYYISVYLDGRLAETFCYEAVPEADFIDVREAGPNGCADLLSGRAGGAGGQGASGPV